MGRARRLLVRAMDFAAIALARVQSPDRASDGCDAGVRPRFTADASQPASGRVECGAGIGARDARLLHERLRRSSRAPSPADRLETFFHAEGDCFSPRAPRFRVKSL